jgi:hypothetical protein
MAVVSSKRQQRSWLGMELREERVEGKREGEGNREGREVEIGWCDGESRSATTAACAAADGNGAAGEGQPGFREDSQEGRIRGITVMGE